MTARSASLRLLVLGVAFISALASCSKATSTSPVALPPSVPEVAVALSEYRFQHRSDVPAGRVVFRITNSGQATHRPSLYPLPDDMPPIDAQLRGTTRRELAPFAGLPFRPPGTASSVAVDLVPGQRYAFICFLEDRDGVPHALKGMSSEFVAGAGTGTGVPTSSRPDDS